MTLEGREFAYCPNCGARNYWPESIERTKADPGSIRCGACAQASVRPRELYAYRIGTTYFDSEPARPIETPTPAPTHCDATIAKGDAMVWLDGAGRAEGEIRCAGALGHRSDHWGYFNQIDTGPATVRWPRAGSPTPAEPADNPEPR